MLAFSPNFPPPPPQKVAATEGMPVLRAGAFCIQQRSPFFRLNAPLFRKIQMDEKNDEDIARMMWDCMVGTFFGIFKNWANKL